MAVKALSGGDKLNAHLAALAAKVATPATLRVGFLEGSTYPDGTSVPMVAAIQEYGAPRAGIPSRAYFRPMIRAKSKEWGPAIGQALVANGYNAEYALQIAGIAIEGQLRDSIIAVMSPALSPVTLMLRKMRSEDQSLVVTGSTVGEAARRVAAGESYSGVSTKPLIDTAHLLNSIGSEVRV